ncbi:cupredoxin domain-containing protein [Phenylobacterium soli]|uniref:cupredoxin domain-containing protein n=1 Tax=Phenylobacterium soli TaxID=2170551 RepID=UPI001D0504D4|nr:cupredoxin domain-containing protein [Phenylobacterium soli]
MRAAPLQILVLGALLTVAGCGKPQPRTFTVTIADMAFGPAPADARVGDHIRFVNADMFEHTATARDGAFDLDLAPKASGEAVLSRAGQLAFYCRFHPGMTGVIAVSP